MGFSEWTCSHSICTLTCFNYTRLLTQYLHSNLHLYNDRILLLRFDEDNFMTFGLSSSLAVLGISWLSDPLTRRSLELPDIW